MEDLGQSAWLQAYRTVEHKAAKNACKNQQIMKKFPKEIEDFGNELVQLQVKRHSADYDPTANFFRTEVLSDINSAENAIRDFAKADIKDRRAFAAWVTMSNRSN